MYIIIKKDTQKTAVVKEISQVAEYLYVSRQTIYNNLNPYSNKKVWETKNFTVYRADFVQIKSNRGKS